VARRGFGRSLAPISFPLVFYFLLTFTSASIYTYKILIFPEPHAPARKQRNPGLNQQHLSSSSQLVAMSFTEYSSSLSLVGSTAFPPLKTFGCFLICLNLASGVQLFNLFPHVAGRLNLIVLRSRIARKAFVFGTF